MPSNPYKEFRIMALIRPSPDRDTASKPMLCDIVRIESNVENILAYWQVRRPDLFIWIHVADQYYSEENPY